MLLSDRTIRELIRKGELVIEPFDESLIGPSSIDIRLGHEFLFFDRMRIESIDPMRPVDDYVKRVRIDDNNALILHPGQFVTVSYTHLTLPTTERV